MPPAVAIETYLDGDGPTLVVLPSYGSDGGKDYDDITARAAGAGWRVLRPQPRGIAGSTARWRASRCTICRTTLRR